MQEELLKTVSNLGSPRVLLIGDFMLDAYIYGDAMRISPEAPVPVLKVVSREYNCGGAGSVAVNLAALGAKPLCIGVIGDDENGRLLTELLNKADADISRVITIPGRPTITKKRLIGLAQHRHRQQLMRIDEESTEALPNDVYDKVLQAYKQGLQDAEIVCLQDYNKGLLNIELCKEMIKAAGQAGKKVLVDPSLISDYSKYTGANLVTPNRKEASIAAGFEINTPDDVAKAAEKLARSLQLEAIVITLDKEGAYLRTGNIDELIGTQPRHVYDVTGAGDAVLATLATTIAAGCDYKTAVQIANLAAGIEVEKFGAVSVTIEEIVNEILGRNKILPIEPLIARLEQHRNRKESIVFTNGCFDVLHRGHIDLLKFCKAQGDIVVIGLNSDSSTRAIKGPNRPINNQHDRAAVLAALNTIDYVVTFDELDPLEIIKKIRPDVLVKGRDWADKGVIGRQFVELHGGKVVLAPLTEGKSSTATIEKIKSISTKPQN
jgi:D-beta-D-heptose 7-phosphate kinase/D-beta-D-heptose 1-phosphate adenosyltransferase